MGKIKWFSPNQGILTVSIASYGITLGQSANQYLSGGEKIRFGISESKDYLFIQIVDSSEDDSYSIPEGIQGSKPIRITCREFIRYLQLETDINTKNTNRYYTSFDSSSRIFTVDLNKELKREKKESVQLEKMVVANNEFFQNLFNPVYRSSSRSFIPISIEDGETKVVENGVKPTIRYGEIDFDLATEGIPDFKLRFNMALVNDTSEKLLGYFLTGGSLKNMTEDEKNAIYDEDFGLLIAVDKNSEIQAMCFVEVYDRLGPGSIIPLSHFEKKPGINNDYIIRQMINKNLPFLVEGDSEHEDSN
ncbi:hypothetical protein QYG89_15935 [Bacillus sp. B190/17]|uniref:Uncharacterized protein n=1 Tax=Bacillus lumedeiriae TaxID=3058829 RepID=A0ABW8ICB5_9BACI